MSDQDDKDREARQSCESHGEADKLREVIKQLIASIRRRAQEADDGLYIKWDPVVEPDAFRGVILRPCVSCGKETEFRRQSDDTPICEGCFEARFDIRDSLFEANRELPCTACGRPTGSRRLISAAPTCKACFEEQKAS
jgi:hypothetical protein